MGEGFFNSKSCTSVVCSPLRVLHQNLIQVGAYSTLTFLENLHTCAALEIHDIFDM